MLLRYVTVREISGCLVVFCQLVGRLIYLDWKVGQQPAAA